LLPLKGTEHQIDLVPGLTIPNRQTFKNNHEETNELQKQVDELMKKGYIQQSIHPYVVTIFLVPKKDCTWRIYVDCRAINNITTKYYILSLDYMIWLINCMALVYFLKLILKVDIIRS